MGGRSGANQLAGCSFCGASLFALHRIIFGSRPNGDIHHIGERAHLQQNFFAECNADSGRLADSERTREQSINPECVSNPPGPWFLESRHALCAENQDSMPSGCANLTIVLRKRLDLRPVSGRFAASSQFGISFPLGWRRTPAGAGGKPNGSLFVVRSITF
jgi:hypothetical protein